MTMGFKVLPSALLPNPGPHYILHHRLSSSDTFCSCSEAMRISGCACDDFNHGRLYRVSLRQTHCSSLKLAVTSTCLGPGFSAGYTLVRLPILRNYSTSDRTGLKCAQTHLNFAFWESYHMVPAPRLHRHSMDALAESSVKNRRISSILWMSIADERSGQADHP